MCRPIIHGQAAALAARPRAPRGGAPLDARSPAKGLNFSFRTRPGDLASLGEASRTFTYETLGANAEIQDFGNRRVAVASPDDLIRMRRAAGRTKDRIELENLLALRYARARRRA